MIRIFNHESAFANSSFVGLRRTEATADKWTRTFSVNYCLYAGVFVSHRYHSRLLAHVRCNLDDRFVIDQTNGLSGNACATAALLGVAGDRLLPAALWTAIGVSAQSMHRSSCNARGMVRCRVVRRRFGFRRLGQSYSRA